jgi:hypothetical protein
MTPEDLRKLYRSEPEATDEEARDAANEARTDPDQARRLLVLLYALAGEERAFGQLLQLVLQAGTMQLLVQAAEADDTFALRMAELILDGMEQMAATLRRTPRGKPEQRGA